MGLDRRQWLALALGGLAGTRTSFAIAASAPASRLHQIWDFPSGQSLELAVSARDLDLSTALDGIADWRIPMNSRLVLRLEDGEHPQRGTLRVRLLSGERVAILGNTAEPARCRLVWSGPADALYVGAGMVLGSIDGVTLEQASRRQRGSGSGVLADEGGVIRCGPAVRVRDHYYGFQARRGGVIRCEKTEAHGGGDANYFAFQAGHISAAGAVASAADDRERGLGSGFVAEYGGSIDAARTTARRNWFAGFTALSNGSIRAYDSRAENNGRAGYLAAGGGTIVAHRALARQNCGDGIVVRDGASSASGSAMRDEGNRAVAELCTPR